MKKFKELIKSIRFADLIDFVIFNLSIFLLIFAWTKFVFKSTLPSFIVTLATCICINIFKNTFSSQKKEKNKLLKQEQLQVEKLSNYMLTQKTSENLQLIKQLYSNKNIKNIKENLILFDDNIAVGFDYEHLQLDHIFMLKTLRQAQNLGATKLYMYCNNCEYKEKLFFENIKNLEVVVLQTSELYNLVKKNNIVIPDLFEQKSISKLKFKQLLEISLDRKKAKKYFFCGLLLFFCSAIVRYNIYYVIMSSFLFFMSIMCLKRKPAQNTF